MLRSILSLQRSARGLILAAIGPAVVVVPLSTDCTQAAPAATLAVDSTWSFNMKVSNLEYLAAPLVDHPPVQARRLPAVEGVAWHALIPRRSPGDPLHQDSRYVPFLAEYVLGQPVRAWCDGNLNGDLSDDEPSALTGYPRLEGARSFLVNLGGNAADMHRVVLEQQADLAAPPRYRLQRVHSMMGEVELEGRRHRAVLHDGNSDGVYTSEFGDGLLVDLDDDLHFETDPMSPAFGPFSTPFQMDSGMYEVSRVAPTGATLTIRRLGDAEPLGPVKPGLPAPRFEMTDTSGKNVRLADHLGRPVIVYFWNSRCGVCEAQAAPLKALYERLRGSGLEILAVSYDAVREEMEAFRRRHGQTWPTSFTGRAYWENPVGRRYRAGGSGLMYLVNDSGLLVGRYTEVRELEGRLHEMIPRAAQASR